MKKQLSCFMIVVLLPLQVGQTLAQDQQSREVPFTQESDAGIESPESSLIQSDSDKEIAVQALRVKELELQLELQRQIAANNQPIVVHQNQQTIVEQSLYSPPYWRRIRPRKHFDLHQLTLDEQTRFTFLEKQRRGVFGPFVQTFAFLGGSIVCAAFSGLNAGPSVYDEYGYVRGGNPGAAAILGIVGAGLLAMSAWGAVRWAKRAKLKREYKTLYRKGIVLTYD